MENKIQTIQKIYGEFGKGNATEKTFESEWVNIWEVIDGKAKNFQAFIDTHKLGSALK